MQIYIDTCVLPRCRLEEGWLYRERFGEQLGFELLLMFDIPDFEANLRQNRAMLEAGPLIFQEPVWGVEHTAARGSMACPIIRKRFTNSCRFILRMFSSFIKSGNWI